MIVYVDSDFRCHTVNDGTMDTVETDYFDGKCKEYIEGYRFVPDGKSWVREDGEVFTGEMAVPWKAFEEIDAVQRKYEQEQMADMKAALNLLGVSVDG